MIKRLIIFSCFLFSPLYAQVTPTLRETTRYSVRELDDWLKKQDRPNFVIPYRYDISGQVLAKWKNVHQSLDGAAVVGSGNRTSNNQYAIDTEVVLLYEYGRAFGNSRLAFSNTGGLFNGSANSINLTRAYIGYHFITYGPHTLDINLGRRELNKMYNSQLMFRSRADGATLFAYYIWKKIVEFQAYAGIYSTSPSSFWLFRGRLFNIADLGFYFDYVFVDWGAVKPSSNVTNIKTKYGCSQFLVGWERKPKWLGTNIQAFAALVLNSRAKPHPLSDNELQNLGGYVGVQYGSTKSKGNFSAQAQLQFCQLQAVAPWDFAGIGRGPVSNDNLFEVSNLTDVNGNTNYKGYGLKFNYALTDQITIGTSLDRSVNLSKRIGPSSSYTNVQASTTYVF